MNQMPDMHIVLAVQFLKCELPNRRLIVSVVTCIKHKVLFLRVYKFVSRFVLIAVHI